MAPLGAHISHTYSTGCSIYFTFAFHCMVNENGIYDSARELAHYLSAKEAVLDHFCAAGGAVSHHHAVGLEPLSWLTKEAAFADGSVIEALKVSVDPTRIMNLGRHMTTAARPFLSSSPPRAPVRMRRNCMTGPS
ncbi:MAG: FAD-linked oxidase C-terminal domain-containing protein [Pseudomonadota bacterium]